MLGVVPGHWSISVEGGSLLEPPDPAASFALRTDTDWESWGSEDWEFRHLRCECFENRHLGGEFWSQYDLHVRGLRLVLRPSTRSGQKLVSPGTFGPKATKAVEYRMSGKAGSKLNGGGLARAKDILAAHGCTAG